MQKKDDIGKYIDIVGTGTLLRLPRNSIMSLKSHGNLGEERVQVCKCLFKHFHNFFNQS